jgi:O-antigen ligase
VIAPVEAGAYTLVWDIVHETRAWFSTEGVASARSAVEVRGARAERTMAPMPRLPPPAMRPGRPALWAAALALARQHPLLGIGPDNFRFAYGPYVGSTRWDSRVHANNSYLEVLVGAGVVGLAAFVWLVAATGITLWRRVATAGTDNHAAAVAAFALWLVIAGHGMVDSFLSFTTTYVTFAVAGGWALSTGLIEEQRDAYRV